MDQLTVGNLLQLGGGAGGLVAVAWLFINLVKLSSQDRQQYNEALAKERAGHEEELKRVAEGHAAELKRVTERYEQQVSAMRQEVSELRTELRAALSELEEERKRRWRAEDAAARYRRAATQDDTGTGLATT